MEGVDRYRGACQRAGMVLLKLELATERDIDSILELIGQTSVWLREKGIQQWSDAFPAELLRGEVERGELFVLREHDQIAASLVLSEFAGELWEDADRAALYLERLAVARPHAGKKLGEGLMKWAEDEARRRGVGIIRLVCEAKNTYLSAFYRRLGYSHLGTKHFAPYKMDFARYEKQL